MSMDIYKGWPLDGAINDNAKPKDAENIVAGMIIKKDANGELIKATGASDEREFFALENQQDYVVSQGKSMAYIVKNAIVLTDQYDTSKTYSFGTPVKVDSGNPGKLTPWTGGDPEPIFGYADGKVTRDSVEYLKVII